MAITELSSGMAIKLRSDQIDPTRAAALAMCDRLVAESLTVLPVTGAALRTADRFVDQHALGLRATDALHVATASEHGATVHTLDQRLATAGPALSVPTPAAGMIEALPRSWHLVEPPKLLRVRRGGDRWCENAQPCGPRGAARAPAAS